MVLYILRIFLYTIKGWASSSVDELRLDLMNEEKQLYLVKSCTEHSHNRSNHMFRGITLLECNESEIAKGFALRCKFITTQTVHNYRK